MEFEERGKCVVLRRNKRSGLRLELVHSYGYCFSPCFKCFFYVNESCMVSRPCSNFGIGIREHKFWFKKL